MQGAISGRHTEPRSLSTHTLTPKLQLRSGSTLPQNSNVQHNVITELRREGLWWERKGVEKMEGGEGICYDIKPLEGKSLKWQAIWWRLLLAVCRGRKATQTPHHFAVAERPLAMMPSLLLVPPWRSLFSKTSYSGSSCFPHWLPPIIFPPALLQQHYSTTRNEPSGLCKP